MHMLGLCIWRAARLTHPSVWTLLVVQKAMEPRSSCGSAMASGTSSGTRLLVALAYCKAKPRNAWIWLVETLLTVTKFGFGVAMVITTKGGFSIRTHGELALLPT